MDADRFDHFARSLTGSSSRRRLVRGLTGAASGLAAPRLPGVARGKKKHKRKKPPTFNQFGCQDIGGRCSGKNGYCCSGICVGKAPKQGETDKSRCKAHDTGTCGTGHDHCDATVGCTTSVGTPGECAFTTGRAGYCFDVSLPGTSCRRGPECQQELGDKAACVFCQSSGAAHCVGILHP